MTLFQIIKSLQTTQGTKAKQAILDANKENELLKEYMKAVFDPAITYGITKVPKVKPLARQESFDMYDIQHAMCTFASRAVTGKAAQQCLAKWMEDQNSEEDQKLIEYIIKRKIADANVGETMVLNTWPNLFFVPPYMRCASMDEKTKAFYRTLPGFLVQTKRDGSFAYLQNTSEGLARTITRQGSIYPTWFSERMIKGVPKGAVLIGEMEVYEKQAHGNALLDRKTGNGILNSVLQDEDESEFENYEFSYVAWDMISESEFKVGKSTRPYSSRFFNLKSLLQNAPKHLCLVGSWEVASVAEASTIHLDHTANGLEGTVWKTFDGEWRDTDSGTKDAVKAKVKFQAEYLITGSYEGEGEAAGMLGGISYSTPCGKIAANVGIGFSNKQRKDFWAIREDLPGKIMTLEANDVISSKTSDTLSLSLAVFIEIRNDRTEADSFERVMEQLKAAKEGM